VLTGTNTNNLTATPVYNANSIDLQFVAATSVTLTSSPNPSFFSQSVSFTATVTSAAGTPTGSVTFEDNGTPLAGGTVALSGPSAIFSTSTLAAGTHTITAVYGTDGNFATSTSSTLLQTVQNATSSTAVTSNTNPSVFGQSVIVSASVTSAASGTPTGTV